MENYSELNKYNIVDQLHLANQFGSDVVIYEGSHGEFNEVELTYDTVKDGYDLEINNVGFGFYKTKGEIIKYVLLTLGGV